MTYHKDVNQFDKEAACPIAVLDQKIIDFIKEKTTDAIGIWDVRFSVHDNFYSIFICLSNGDRVVLDK